MTTEQGEHPGITTYPGILPDVPGDEPVEQIGNYLTGSEIREILGDLGLGEAQATSGAAIALCEAPGPTSISGHATADFCLVDDEPDAIWGYAYGGFQIKSLHNQQETGLPRDEELLLDPRFNCRTALAIKRVYGWSYWPSYGTDLYKEHVQALLDHPMLPPPKGANVVSVGPGELPIMRFALGQPN